jgi:hypothetical protein
MVEIKEDGGRIVESSFVKNEEGGLKIDGCVVTIEKCEFYDNNPKLENFVSFRRNIICLNEGTINLESLKGGDGLFPNTYLCSPFSFSLILFPFLLP